MSNCGVTDRNLFERRHDRRGRGLRMPLIPFHLPGHRTRREAFDDLVVEAALLLRQVLPPVNEIQFATEDIAPSDPAPWEESTMIFGRLFPQDRVANLPTRMVLYRLPILERCRDRQELKNAIADVLSENLGAFLPITAEEIRSVLKRRGFAV